MNFVSFIKYSTVEFRQLAGTKDPDMIVRWVGDMLRFVERGLTAPEEEVYALKREVKDLEAFMGPGWKLERYY